MNPVASALREVASVLRMQGSFNDLAVSRAFASMVELLEKRAAALETPESQEIQEPAVVIETTSETIWKDQP